MATLTVPYTKVVSQHDDFEGWLEAHKTGVGGSEIAAILQEHPKKSALRVWAEKTGRRIPDDLGDIEAVHWGLVLEPIVAEEFMRRTGITIERCGWLLRSNAYPWLICTPDYLDLEGNPVQIKTTSAFRLKDWSEGAPRVVYLQVQAEMAVTGAKRGYAAVLVGGQKFMWDTFERDETTIARILERGERFWRFVETDQWPDLDGSEDETAVIADLYPFAAEGEQIPLPLEASEWTAELEVIDRQIKELTDRRNLLRNQLKATLGNAELGILGDGSGWSYKTVSRKGYEVAPTTTRMLRRVKAV